MLKKILGLVLVSTPATCTFASIALKDGLKAALLILAFSVLLLAMVIVGAYLLMDD